ncbi:GroES-like protein [Abortiporus biennis]|nr:GroES-like protein [Abortiporus biennis]
MSVAQIPLTMKALITQANNTATVEVISVPTIADDEVLVRTAAVALNPIDWKFIDFFNHPGTIIGVDFAGKIVKVGKNVTDVAVGDNVASFVHGGIKSDRGAFAQYVKAADELVWKIPDGSITFEEAATLNCGFWTGVQSLFHPKRLGLVEPPKKVSGEEWVFINGGSSSLGLYGVNLAHLAGYKVVSVASPKNIEVVKSYGADAVFDYNDLDIIKKIKEVSKDSIHNVYDTISSESSQILSVQVLAPGPGKVLVVRVLDETDKLRKDVQIIHTLLFTALGSNFYHLGNEFYPASSEDRAQVAQFVKKMPELVKNKLVKPNPVKSFAGGLAGIPEALQYLKEGKNSGEKVVLRVD